MSVRVWPDPTGELGPRPTIIDYLFDDGEKIEALLEEVQHLVEDGGFAAARPPLVTLACRLDRHMRLEESAVLPGLPVRASTLLDEHAALRRLLTDAQQHVNDRDGVRAARAIARLRRALLRHELHERRVLARYRSRV